MIRRYFRFGGSVSVLDGSGLGYFSIRLLEPDVWHHYSKHPDTNLSGRPVPLLFLTLNGVVPL